MTANDQLGDALGLLETVGLSATLVAVDVMEKSAHVRVVQCELNDLGGVCTKITGPTAAVQTAIERGRQSAEQMGGKPVAHVVTRPDRRAWSAIRSPREFNPLIQQDAVFFAQFEPADSPAGRRSTMNQETISALGLIETQGFIAVFEAIDTACKVANVEVVGKEKLGGGYITVIIKGDLAAVKAAVEAGQAKVEGLGKLIAAHVLARPSEAVLGLLPKA